MATNDHYYIERKPDGTYNVENRQGQVVSSGHRTQEEAIGRAKQLNPNDHPDVERIRHTPQGGPDKWRPAKE
jgi:hypothetical protein